MHVVGHPGALAPDHDPVVRGEGELGVGNSAAGGQQHQPPGLRQRPVGRPGAVPDQGQLVDVVHPGPAQLAVVQNEAAGLDQVQRHPESRRQTHQSPGVLGNVRFEENEAHEIPFWFSEV